MHITTSPKNPFPADLASGQVACTQESTSGRVRDQRCTEKSQAELSRVSSSWRGGGEGRCCPCPHAALYPQISLQERVLHPVTRFPKLHAPNVLSGILSPPPGGTSTGCAATHREAPASQLQTTYQHASSPPAFTGTLGRYISARGSGRMV